MHIYILPQCSTTAASVLNSAGMDAQFERSCCAISRGILTMTDITQKWTGRRQDWSMIHAQLAVFFAERMPN